MDYNVTFIGGPYDGLTKQAKINFVQINAAHPLTDLELTFTQGEKKFTYKFKDGINQDVRFEIKA